MTLKRDRSESTARRNVAPRLDGLVTHVNGILDSLRGIFVPPPPRPPPPAPATALSRGLPARAARRPEQPVTAGPFSALFPVIRIYPGLSVSETVEATRKQLVYPVAGTVVGDYVFGAKLAEGGNCVIVEVQKGSTPLVSRVNQMYEQRQGASDSRQIWYATLAEIMFWQKLKAEADRSTRKQAFVDMFFVRPVDVFGFAEPQNMVHFIFEMALGDLHDVVRSRSCHLPIVGALVDIASGIHFMHKNLMIAHCDVKDANILVRMVNGKLRCSISDFDAVTDLEDTGRSDGLLLFEDGITADQVLGTPSSHPPELCTGRHYMSLPDVDDSHFVRDTLLSERVDEFALGCLLANVIMLKYPPDVQLVHDALPIFTAMYPNNAFADVDGFSLTLQNGKPYEFLALPLIESSIQTHASTSGAELADTRDDMEFLKTTIGGLTQSSVLNRTSVMNVISAIQLRYGNMDEVYRRSMVPVTTTSGVGSPRHKARPRPRNALCRE